MGARPVLAKEPLIPFKSKKWTFLLKSFQSSINDDFMILRGGVLGRPLLQAWLLPDLNTIPDNCVRENLFSSVVMVLAFQPGGPYSNPSEHYISAMHLLISFFVTDFHPKKAYCIHNM